MIVSMLFAGVSSFWMVPIRKNHVSPTFFQLRDQALPESIEVCGFKDCKRAGGGAKLEKLIHAVSFYEFFFLVHLGLCCTM